MHTVQLCIEDGQYYSELPGKCKTMSSLCTILLASYHNWSWVLWAWKLYMSNEQEFLSPLHEEIKFGAQLWCWDSGKLHNAPNRGSHSVHTFQHGNIWPQYILTLMSFHFLLHPILSSYHCTLCVLKIMWSTNHWSVSWKVAVVGYFFHASRSYKVLLSHCSLCSIGWHHIFVLR